MESKSLTFVSSHTDPCGMYPLYFCVLFSSLCKTFVLGGLITLFHCSIPLTRFASYHHTRETLKGVCSCTRSKTSDSAKKKKKEHFLFFSSKKKHKMEGGSGFWNISSKQGRGHICLECCDVCVYVNVSELSRLKPDCNECRLSDSSERRCSHSFQPFQSVDTKGWSGHTPFTPWGIRRNTRYTGRAGATAR